MVSATELVAGAKMAGVGGAAGAAPFIGGGLAVISVGKAGIGTVPEGHEALKVHRHRLMAIKDERLMFFRKVLRGSTYGSAEAGFVFSLPIIDRWQAISTQDETLELEPLEIDYARRKQAIVKPLLTWGVVKRRDDDKNPLSYSVSENKKDGSVESIEVPYDLLLYRAITRTKNGTELAQATRRIGGEGLRKVLPKNRSIFDIEADAILPDLIDCCKDRLLKEVGTDIRGLGFVNIAENNVHTQNVTHSFSFDLPRFINRPGIQTS